MHNLQHFSKIEFQCFLPLVLNGVPAPLQRHHAGADHFQNTELPEQIRQRLVFGFARVMEMEETSRMEARNTLAS